MELFLHEVIHGKILVAAVTLNDTAQKIEGFFGKCDQIRRKLRIWSFVLKKSLMERVIFCAV